MITGVKLGPKKQYLLLGGGWVLLAPKFGVERVYLLKAFWHIPNCWY
jgi:hypothetical protein